jgi:hypothetical protein
VDEDGRGFYDDGDRLLTRRTRRVCLLDLADDVLDSLLNLLHGAALAGPAKVRDSAVKCSGLYRGSSSASVISWRVSVQPIPPRIESARRTVTRTDGTRPSPRRWRLPTTGLKRNVSSTASASGINTACSQYRPATTSAMIPHPLFMSVPSADDARGEGVNSSSAPLSTDPALGRTWGMSRSLLNLS